MDTSPHVIKQVAREALSLGLSAELEVSKSITRNYGGPLLENAAIAEQHWPIAASVNPAPNNITDPTVPHTPSGYINPWVATTGPGLSHVSTSPPLLLESRSNNKPTETPAVADTHGALFGNTPVLSPPVMHEPFRTSGSSGGTPPIADLRSRIGPYSINFKNAARHRHGEIPPRNNLGVATEDATLGGIKRLGGIWVYCARGFDALLVSLRSGILGGIY